MEGIPCLCAKAVARSSSTALRPRAEGNSWGVVSLVCLPWTEVASRGHGGESRGSPWEERGGSPGSGCPSHDSSSPDGWKAVRNMNQTLSWAACLAAPGPSGAAASGRCLFLLAPPPAAGRRRMGGLGIARLLLPPCCDLGSPLALPPHHPV